MLPISVKIGSCLQCTQIHLVLLAHHTSVVVLVTVAAPLALPPPAAVHCINTLSASTLLFEQGCKHLYAVCQMLVDDHDGTVPQTFEDLEKLPGVGHKTASVVICTAFGYAAARSTCCCCDVSCGVRGTINAGEAQRLGGWGTVWQ